MLLTLIVFGVETLSTRSQYSELEVKDSWSRDYEEVEAQYFAVFRLVLARVIFPLVLSCAYVQGLRRLWDRRLRVNGTLRVSSVLCDCLEGITPAPSNHS